MTSKITHQMEANKTEHNSKYKQEMFVNIMPFKKYFFVTDVLYNLIWLSTIVWIRNSFSKLLFKQFCQIWPRWPWPL